MRYLTTPDVLVLLVTNPPSALAAVASKTALVSNRYLISNALLYLPANSLLIVLDTTIGCLATKLDPYLACVASTFLLLTTLIGNAKNNWNRSIILPTPANNPASSANGADSDLPNISPNEA